MASLLIGITSFNDLPLLRESLKPLEALRAEGFARVILLDNAANEDVRVFVQKEYPQIEYRRHPEGNLGYGRSYNTILQKAPGYEFFLVVTSDVLVDPAVVKELVAVMQTDTKLSLAGGKVHHWGREGRNKVIDSVGIGARPWQHFYDRGQGELDRGQYDSQIGRVFGISGAVFLLRTSVVPRLHGSEWQIFDERMWMYKEDIDLSYRLRWLGEKICVFPKVWAWHRRSAFNKEGQRLSDLRKADALKPSLARLHSYKNHLLLLKNNFTWRFGPRIFLLTVSYEILKGLYLLVRHPLVLVAGLRALLFVSAKRSPRVISPKEMLAYFE